MNTINLSFANEEVKRQWNVKATPFNGNVTKIERNGTKTYQALPTSLYANSVEREAMEDAKLVTKTHNEKRVHTHDSIMNLIFNNLM